MKQHFRTITVGSVGNIMEWFDFSIFGYFAPIIARVFFPPGDPFLSLLAELCPARIRMTVFSIAYNLSMAVVGGTTPLIATLLIRELNSKAAPSFFLILVGLICLLIMLGLKETRGRDLKA